MDYEVRAGDTLVSTNRRLLDVDGIHTFLSQESYWATGISRERFLMGLEHSIPFGVYSQAEQAGFCRVITDRATFAYLADLFVNEQFRRRGLSKVLLGAALRHPELQGLKRWMLGTRDAHSLYARFGFSPLSTPGRWMDFVPADTFCTTE
jgi:GNAT superfamily N-acetyltransferase